jgi:hypothetical protein
LAPLTVFAQDGFYVIPVVVNKPLKNVITIAKANGKFTNPVAAVNSITDASASNPYLVVIGPGVYTVTSPVVMKPHVDIAGSGENVTKITGAIIGETDMTSAIILGANNSALGSLTVENTGGGPRSIALFNNNASTKFSNVTAMAKGGTSNTGVLNISSSPTMTGVTATASGGESDYGVYNNASSPIMTGVTTTASGGTSQNHGVFNTNTSNPTMTDLTATGEGLNSHGVMNSYSSGPYIRRSTLKGDIDGLATGSTATISQSTIIGGVVGPVTSTCVACDNGSGTALGADCN